MTRVFEAVAKNGIIVLPSDVPSPSRCLVAIVDEDFEQLRSDAELSLPELSQQRMADLLQRNRDGLLTAAERAELDELGREFDSATLKRGRALSILAQLEAGTGGGQ